MGRTVTKEETKVEQLRRKETTIVTNNEVISFFMVAWSFGFWMFRQTLARVVLYMLSAEYSVVMCGAWPGTLGPDRGFLSVWYTVMLWDFISDMRHVAEMLVPGFGLPVLLCRGKIPRARGMATYVRDGYGAFRQPQFECGSCEMLVFRICGVRQNLYVYSLYRNPDL